jgi:hypothetical protein
MALIQLLTEQQGLSGMQSCCALGCTAWPTGPVAVFPLLQLLAKTKAVAMLAPMTVRMEVTHVKLRGRLRLGLLLGQEAPGIQ